MPASMHISLKYVSRRALNAEFLCCRLCRMCPHVSMWIHTNAVFTDAICRIPYLRYYGICCSQAIRITDFTHAFPDAELLSTSTLGLVRKIEYSTFCSASFFDQFNLIISFSHYFSNKTKQKKYCIEFRVNLHIQKVYILFFYEVLS